MDKRIILFLLLFFFITACGASQKSEIYDYNQMTVEKIDSTVSECRRTCQENYKRCLSEKSSKNKTLMENRKLDPKEFKAQVKRLIEKAKEIERKCKHERSGCFSLCIE